jgi:endonuclease-3 related protein
MSGIGKNLLAMYEAMRRRFGPQGWWPASADAGTGERALEICVGAILTQNTNWSNVEKALANLASAGCMSVSALHGKPHAELAKLIRPAGYFNVKARRLKNFIARLRETHGDDIRGFLDRPAATLREELLSISGIGRETADSIILYAAGKCTFVVDAYTARVLFRHRLIDAEADYETIKELLESNLPEDLGLFNDFHAQFVAVGKTYCRPSPRCAGCPLEEMPHDPAAGTEEA